MGADYIVDLPCEAKLAFGAGDARAGTLAMAAMIKALQRAQLLEQNSPGQDPSTLKLTVVRMTREGRSEHEVTHADLLAEAAPLEAHADACERCPANIFGEDHYGCYGALPYPVTAVAEQWLVNRLQPADSPGGFLLLSAICDFNYNGSPIRDMRSAGMFELPRPAEKVVRKKLLASTRVNGDQLFQAFFSVGSALGAGHCSMLLLFVGALEINGRVPATNADAHMLAALGGAKTPDERRQLAKLVLGPERPELFGMHDLLRAAYTAWVLDVDLLMDA